MDNDEVLEALEAQEGGVNTEIVDDDEILRFLVFRLGESLYALAAEDVREISSDAEVYYVPFVPPYVLGYANRHGQPYTVFDLNMLFENTPLDGTSLLILKSENDQIALRITDVREILKIPASRMHRITSKDSSARYFSGALEMNEQEVFVLNIETLVERLEQDLG